MFWCCILIRAVSFCCFCLKLDRNWLPLLNDVFRAELVFELGTVSSRLVEFVLCKVFFCAGPPNAPIFV